MSSSRISAILWEQGKLRLLDQRLLPLKEVYLSYDNVNSVVEAIRDMVVRGAPAIGITAAYGVVLAAKSCIQSDPSNWQSDILDDLDALKAARPTAVNLAWAIDRMHKVLSQCSTDDAQTRLLQEAKTIHREDIESNHKIGRFGAELMLEGSSVLTHCNAGALATGGYGTALGVIRAGFDVDKIKRVYADETRPWLQGARLTAWELLKDNIPVTLLPDGAASHLFKSGEVDWVVVGADRIGANGDVANKIGTYGLAVSARYHGVKFMVAAPTSSIDMNSPSGESIPIEHRDASEVKSFMGVDCAPPEAGAWNPVFDVTPADLVDAIVT